MNIWLNKLSFKKCYLVRIKISKTCTNDLGCLTRLPSSLSIALSFSTFYISMISCSFPFPSLLSLMLVLGKEPIVIYQHQPFIVKDRHRKVDDHGLGMCMPIIWAAHVFQLIHQLSQKSEVAPPPGQPPLLYIFPSISIFIHDDPKMNIISSTSLDHKSLLGPTPFILGNRISTDDDSSATLYIAWLVDPLHEAWIWANLELYYCFGNGSPTCVGVLAAISFFFLHHQLQAAMGEALATTLGNYLPGLLNLLDSLAGCSSQRYN